VGQRRFLELTEGLAFDLGNAGPGVGNLDADGPVGAIVRSDGDANLDARRIVTEHALTDRDAPVQSLHLAVLALEFLVARL